MAESLAGLWFYDTTLASAVIAMWWLAELCSKMSQRRLAYASDFNRTWSALTICLAMTALSSFGVEQYIRTQLAVSAPVTIAIVALVSFSYIAGPKRLRLFDSRVKLMQEIVRADKTRFGRPGSLGQDKYIIKWSPWMHGDPENSWKEANSGLYPDHQIIWDWGTSHRTGSLSNEDIWNSIHGSDIEYWASIGILLYSWLPKGAHEHLNFDDTWQSRGRLRGGYGGAKGRRLGLNASELPFAKWIALSDSHHMEHFKLIAVEYSSATEQLCRALPQITESASSPAEIAASLMDTWKECIDSSKKNTASPTVADRTVSSSAKFAETVHRTFNKYLERTKKFIGQQMRVIMR